MHMYMELDDRFQHIQLVIIKSQVIITIFLRLNIRFFFTKKIDRLFIISFKDLI
jgi:hypothetical protein